MSAPEPMRPGTLLVLLNVCRDFVNQLAATEREYKDESGGYRKPSATEDYVALGSAYAFGELYLDVMERLIPHEDALLSQLSGNSSAVAFILDSKNNVSNRKVKTINTAVDAHINSIKFELLLVTYSQLQASALECCKFIDSGSDVLCQVHYKTAYLDLSEAMNVIAKMVCGDYVAGIERCIDAIPEAKSIYEQCKKDAGL